MKHLLIILSFILLSSFITSCGKNRSSPLIVDNHKGENTFYRWGEGGYYNWMRFGDKETHPKYKGNVENGVPNGLGLMITTNGDKYEGEWMDGLKHGQGTYTWNDGEKYVGEFKDGLPNGQGIVTSPEGKKYEGEFKNGEIVVRILN